ncbi:hypothetical protein ABZ990_22160 [Streptomyces sp. NPDC046203]|uniref:hypothetical protein n=1 Tax=Streptomyces sp. NPDC046203 TaxID=3154602 RepID=UPI0033C73E00
MPEINIELTPETQKQFSEGNWSLYGFKAVSAGGATNGRPVVWFGTSDLLETVTVDWQESYGTFIATGHEIPSGVIKTSTKRDIKLGQVMTVSAKGSVSLSTTNAVAGSISVKSEATKLYTTGVSQTNVNGEMLPIAAFPLHGQTTVVMKPMNIVLLTFANTDLSNSLVKETAIAKSVIVDMTENAKPVNIGYTINVGWDTRGLTNVEHVETNADIVGKLIL